MPAIHAEWAAQHLELIELLQKNLKEAYVPVSKNFERMKAMLEEHIEGHFPTTPTILAICKNFIDERKSFKLA